MSTVLHEISHWAVTLPYWEQAALEKIINGVAFTEADYEELLTYLLEDAELTPPAEEPRPTLTFPHASNLPAGGHALRLKKISNLQNINALVPDQELTFGPHLTAIFGANGTGKSGYARVIGNAAFTRGDQEILTDVTRSAADPEPLTADITLTDGKTDKTISFEVGQPYPEMRSFYVFDSTSVRAHLTQSNPMSFSPAGLAYLTQLANVTDQVRKRLTNKIEAKKQVNLFIPQFSSDTEVGQQVEQLNAKTDLNALKKLAQLSAQETKELDELADEIAHLRSLNIPDEIEVIKQAMVDMQQLANKLQKLAAAVSNDRLDTIADEIKQWRSLDAAAEQLGATQFQNEHFTQTGSDPWYAFIQAARTLAEAETTPEEPYPQPHHHCLLCHQPLAPPAQNLLKRLWVFLENDTQTQLDTLNTELNTAAASLTTLDTDFFTDQSVAYRYLHQDHPDLAETVRTFVKAAQGRKMAAINAIRQHTDTAWPPLPDHGIDSINAVITQLEQQETNLESQNPANQISELTQRKKVLEDKNRLAQLLPDIEKFVENRRWVARASSRKVQRSTSHITRKYNDLFDRLVTQKYIQLFQETLTKLNCPLRLEIQTRARKGKTFKQIALQTDETISADQARPEKVLSEGEQRAVALADFLTEVALDDHSTGVILDDPVSSLDFGWKETIATHLVAEAQHRQVIVFTHDLHFLYCLKEAADKLTVQIAAHWIEKRDEKPGWVFLNNSPLSEKDYKTSGKVHQIYARAMSDGISPEEQQRLLREGFGALRTCYEAFVIFELFCEVVTRFGERISIGRLNEVVVDRTIVETVIEKSGLLSRYIEGHLHSDPYNSQKPTPAKLLAEIEAFDELRKQQKNLKKQLKSG